MKSKIKIILFLLIMCLTACSKKEIIENKYDNISYYNSFNHKVVEVENGFFTIYEGLAVFINKEDNKYYLLSKEKENLIDLLKDEELKYKSMAYFGDSAEIFYDNEKLYIFKLNELVEYDYNKGIIKKILDTKDSNNAILKNQLFIYSEYDYDEKQDKLTSNLSIYDINTNKKEVLLDFVEMKPQAKDCHISKPMLVKDNIVFKIFDTYEEKESFNERAYFGIYNLKNKKFSTINVYKNINGREYKINTYYEKDGELYLNYTENSQDWAKYKTMIYKLDIGKLELEKYKELPELFQIGSNGKEEFIYPLEVVNINKVFDKKSQIADGYINDIKYIITKNDKKVEVSDDNFYKKNHSRLAFSNEGYAILKYDNGAIKIIKDGKVINIFEEIMYNRKLKFKE